MRRLTAALALVPALLLAGCGDESARGAHVSPGPGSSTEPEKAYATPPAILLATDATTLPAWRGSYCWETGGKGMCVDMAPPEPGQLPDVASPAHIDFSFPVPDTQFRASFKALGDGCQPDYRGRVTELGEGRFRLEPAGPAGRYQVDLYGRASQGEVPGSFLWTTPVDGPLGEPRVQIAIVGKRDGVLVGDGFELRIEDLPRRPKQASSTVTATAGNGESMTFDAGRADLSGCAEDGFVWFFERAGRLSQHVAGLGPEPFRYDVELVLDGTTYTASAIWPDDHGADPENDSPDPVPLVFNAPLPARE